MELIILLVTLNLVINFSKPEYSIYFDRKRVDSKVNTEELQGSYDDFGIPGISIFKFSCMEKKNGQGEN